MGVNVESSEQQVRSFTKTTEIHKLASELRTNCPTNHNAEDARRIIVRAKNSVVYGQGFAPPGRKLFSVSKSENVV